MTANDTASKVLIVDDEEVGRESMELLLQSEGYALSFAASGLEAIDQAREILPDIILLDVMMPRMDGFEVCARMREDSLLADVPIVFVTALDDTYMRLNGLKSGADDYITKPVERNELRLRVRNITRLNRYRKLLAERSKFEWVVEEAEEGYLLLDGEDRITYANPTARRYLALPESSESRVTFLAHARGIYRFEPETEWENWPAESPQPRYLVRAETPRERALWLKVQVHGGERREETRIVALRNVTEQVIRTQKTWFFQDIIAHKLNTPLQALSGLDYVLAKDDLSDDSREMLELARTGSHELQDRVQRILNYLNEDRAQENPSFTSVEKLAELVADVSDDLGVATQLHEPFPACHVAMSEANLHALLWELCGNAKKFHPEQRPLVEIRATRTQSNGLSLEILDNGQHLPSEVLNDLWIPYFQHEKFFTGQMSGMGLGLSMVASLVWNSGGSYRLRNREDCPGIRVEILLPIAEIDALESP